MTTRTPEQRRRRAAAVVAGSLAALLIVGGAWLVARQGQSLASTEARLNTRSAVIDYLGEFSRWQSCLVKLDGQFGDARAGVDDAVAELDDALTAGLIAGLIFDDQAAALAQAERAETAQAQLTVARRILDAQRNRRLHVEEPEPAGCGPIPTAPEQPGLPPTTEGA